MLSIPTSSFWRSYSKAISSRSVWDKRVKSPVALANCSTISSAREFTCTSRNGFRGWVADFDLERKTLESSSCLLVPHFTHHLFNRIVLLDGQKQTEIKTSAAPVIEAKLINAPESRISALNFPVSILGIWGEKRKRKMTEIGTFLSETWSSPISILNWDSGRKDDDNDNGTVLRPIQTSCELDRRERSIELYCCVPKWRWIRKWMVSTLLERGWLLSAHQTRLIRFENGWIYYTKLFQQDSDVHSNEFFSSLDLLSNQHPTSK